MENNEIMNVTENATEIATTGISTKKLGAGEITMLGFAGIGVIATGYGAYKGIKWLIKKIKANKDAKKVEEAPEEAKAEESSAE